jgi:hypothetical protein
VGGEEWTGFRSVTDVTAVRAALSLGCFQLAVAERDGMGDSVTERLFAIQLEELRAKLLLVDEGDVEDS